MKPYWGIAFACCATGLLLDVAQLALSGHISVLDLGSSAVGVIATAAMWGWVR